eukprot:snap_masked-scaffold_2-processed-gene-1.39-mRNA-1 protein AED:1.00 eAED:1.00 QI:0/0/0/0/1/1/3/0/90
MPVKILSIKQQFQNRNRKDKSYDEKNQPCEVERFKQEARLFVKQLEINKEVEILRFRNCPFYSIGKYFARLLEKLPNVGRVMYLLPLVYL